MYGIPNGINTSDEIRRAVPSAYAQLLVNFDKRNLFGKYDGIIYYTW